MNGWTEITDEKRIALYNTHLNTKLKRGTSIIGPVRIGFPNGSFESTVRVNQLESGEHIWLYSGKSKKTDDFLNLVGQYTPGQKEHYLIDLQFNFHDGGFNRKKGGAFVTDGSGKVFLAHRGIVTKGSARVEKGALLRCLNWKHRVIAKSNVRPNKVDLLVVGALEDPKLVSKVTKFASAMREAAAIAVTITTPKTPSSKSLPPNQKSAAPSNRTSKIDIDLTDYRDEFAGTRVVKRKGQVVMHWKHGAIIKALCESLQGVGDIMNCKAADLVVRHGKFIDLFEAKSKSDSQSIYTAIDQLVFNGDVLRRQFKSHTVRTFLVLPSSTKDQARQDRCRELGFGLVTLEQVGNSYKFFGLPA